MQSRRNLKVCFLTISQLPIGQIKKVRSVLKSACSEQSVDTKSLRTLGLYKDQLRTQILKNKYQLETKSDSRKEDQGPGLKVIF